jgi:SPP1 gp7 family putative phage head morphogenesis protein
MRMSKSSEYWGNRLNEVAQRRFDLTQIELERKLKKLYKGASKRVQLKVEELYYKLLEEGKISTTDLYSYKRYIDLQEELNKELADLGMQEVQLMNPSLTQAFEEVFEQTIKAMGSKAVSFTTVNPMMVQQLVNANWSGEHFSNRIWTNKDKLVRLLKGGIEDSIINGTSKDKLVEQIQVTFGKGFADADRIVRSELMHIINEGQRQSYKENGYAQLEILVTLDERTCKTCGPKDGKKIPIDSNEIPPIHARCRCTAIPVIEGDKDGQTRLAKDPITGEKYKVPADMTYDEWYEKHVIEKYGKEKVELHMKKLKNQNSDTKQYQKYKDVLGKEAPKSFDKFQDLKYTNGEGWKFQQLDYKRRKQLIDNPSLILPDVGSVKLPEQKFTQYLFGGSNADGLAKGRAFESRLGYNINNWNRLSEEVKNRAKHYPVTSKGSNGFGERFEQKIIVYGEKGKPANVVVGWIYNSNGVSMTSVYIKEV